MRWDEVRVNREWQLREKDGAVHGTVFAIKGGLFSWFSQGQSGEEISFDEARGKVEALVRKVGKG